MQISGRLSARRCGSQADNAGCVRYIRSEPRPAGDANTVAPATRPDQSGSDCSYSSPPSRWSASDPDDSLGVGIAGREAGRNVAELAKHKGQV